MANTKVTQLFDVKDFEAAPANADRYTDIPVIPSFSVTGSMAGKRKLRQGDEAMVTISGPDGEVIGVAKARIEVSFKDHEKDGVVLFVERKQKAIIVDGS